MNLFSDNATEQVETLPSIRAIEGRQRPSSNEIGQEGERHLDG